MKSNQLTKTNSRVGRLKFLALAVVTAASLFAFSGKGEAYHNINSESNPPVGGDFGGLTVYLYDGSTGSPIGGHNIKIYADDSSTYRGGGASRSCSDASMVDFTGTDQYFKEEWATTDSGGIVDLGDGRNSDSYRHNGAKPAGQMNADGVAGCACEMKIHVDGRAGGWWDLNRNGIYDEGNAGQGFQEQLIKSWDHTRLYNGYKYHAVFYWRALNGQVLGRVFQDNNGNGGHDAGEPFIQNGAYCGNYVNANASVTVDNVAVVYPNQCNQDPYYSINLNPGTYTVRVNPPPDWEATTGPITVGVCGGCQHHHWFGVKPIVTTINVQSSPVTGISPVNASNCYSVTNDACGTTNWTMQNIGSMSTTLTAPAVFRSGETDYRFTSWQDSACGYCYTATPSITASTTTSNRTVTVIANYVVVPHEVRFFKGQAGSDGDISQLTVNLTSSGDYTCGCTNVPVAVTPPVPPTSPYTHSQSSRIDINVSAAPSITISGGSQNGYRYVFDRWEFSSFGGGTITNTNSSATFSSPVPTASQTDEITLITAYYRLYTYRVQVLTSPANLQLNFDAVPEDTVEPTLSCATGRSFTGTSAYTLKDMFPILDCRPGDPNVHFNAPAQVETGNALYRFKEWTYTPCGGNPAAGISGQRASVRVTAGDCDNILTAVYEFKEFKVRER